MTMSPEERRRRMHKALNKNGSQRSQRQQADAGAEIPDIEVGSSKREGASAYAESSASACGEASTTSYRTEAFTERTSTPVGRRLRELEAEDVSESVQHRRTRRSSASEDVSDRRNRRAPEADDDRIISQAADKRRSRSSDKPDSTRKSSGGGNSGRARRRGSKGPSKLLILIAALVCILVLVLAVKAVVGAVNNKKQARLESESASIAESSIAESESESEAIAAEESADDLEKAKLMYAQYDYDNAIDLLKSLPDYDENTEAQELAAKCEETKATLEEQDIYKITHVFFHILCVDPENSFDESKWGTQAGGYNSLMTTISEFEKMIQEMYDKGFVLVSLHDIAHEETQADGTTRMVKGSIMLPPGKRAFVMSEDDVCYYEYMEGAGYADKMIVGDDGRPTLHYTDKDGNEFVGDYDLVPILDKFIDEHPDFSYKGHKACLVFTGYNGVLGYRTDESYDPNSEYYDPKLEQGHDIEAERKEAIEVMKALYADGYDLGSHSWGHRDLGAIEMDRFKKDCDRWNRNVAPLIKEATGSQPDIIIFPKGADIGDWHPYASDNERFKYMYNLGFRYFCNVDNNQYWVQLGDTYLRQGRRALDGLNMWLQISGQNTRLSDLFDDVSSIFDPARPTPVPSY